MQRSTYHRENGLFGTQSPSTAPSALLTFTNTEMLRN